MAKVFRRAAGRAVDEIIANCAPVQDALSRVARARGARAEAILSESRDTGASRITVESGLSDVNYGHIDRFVVLDDTAGQDAAMSIEFGRKPGENGKGGMKPVAPLRRAFDLTGD